MITRGPGKGGDMRAQDRVVVGLDNGGTNNNATVLGADGDFLIDRLVETPSLVREGPDVAVAALVAAFDGALTHVNADRSQVIAVGLATPGPASATGIISVKGSTNFNESRWHGFDIRGAIQERLGLPVVYLNDGNAAALYAHQVRYGPQATRHSSVAAIVGTGLGGGLVESGRVITGASGMAGELGHVNIPLTGLLGPGQPTPVCNCGLAGDVESIASLTALSRNLLPYWLARRPDHELTTVPVEVAARRLRGLAEAGDALARQVFEQQAMALGRLFTIIANVTDPHTYFIGGGVVETEPEFREWFRATVAEHTALRWEQSRFASFALVPDLDMAGARGAAVAALTATAGSAGHVGTPAPGVRFNS